MFKSVFFFSSHSSDDKSVSDKLEDTTPSSQQVSEEKERDNQKYEVETIIPTTQETDESGPREVGGNLVTFYTFSPLLFLFSIVGIASQANECQYFRSI